jgi:hypothetical protein
MTRPKLIAHADWSSSPKKTWMAVARLNSGREYIVAEPKMVNDSTKLLNQFKTFPGGGCVLLGFDFPIGLPAAYCQRAGINSFLDVLPEFGEGCWSRFYQVATNRSEISIRQPFYPYAPGGKSRQHLLDALGIKEMKDLLRDCEHATKARAAASPLFWTLGAKQVGRAAIAGWRDVLAPAMRRSVPLVKLWPFAGALDELLESSDIVIVETYPAQACVQIGLGAPGRGWSKRNQADRQRFSEIILDWAKEHSVELETSLVALLGQGFGDSSYGEDKFDAVVGVLGMLDIILHDDWYDAPAGTKVWSVEGWIFGLAPHNQSVKSA